MIDEAEIAADITDLMTAAAARKRKPEPTIRATGKCLWCGVRVIKGRRWCGSECRDSWEDENQ